MATKNTFYSNKPIEVDKGGTGNASLSNNSVLVGNGTGPITQVTPGATNTVLTSNGPGLDPSFKGFNGNLVLLETKWTSSTPGATTIEFLNIDSYTYDNFLIIIGNIAHNSNNLSQFNMQIGTASSYVTSGYQSASYSLSGSYWNSTSNLYVSPQFSSRVTSNDMRRFGVSGTIWLNGINSGNDIYQSSIGIYNEWYANDSNVISKFYSGSGFVADPGATVTRLKFQLTVGTFPSTYVVASSVSLYGLSE